VGVAGGGVQSGSLGGGLEPKPEPGTGMGPELGPGLGITVLSMIGGLALCKTGLVSWQNPHCCVCQLLQSVHLHQIPVVDVTCMPTCLKFEMWPQRCFRSTNSLAMLISLSYKWKGLVWINNIPNTTWLPLFFMVARRKTTRPNRAMTPGLKS